MGISTLCLSLLLVFSGQGVVGQQFEFDSPCPNIYEVLYDDVEWHGILQVPTQFQGPCMWIEFFFVTDKEIKMMFQSFRGSVELTGSREKVFEKILTRKFVKYKVHFPNQAVVPDLGSIKINGVEVCKSPYYVDHENYLYLKHFLYIGDSKDKHSCKNDDNPEYGFYVNRNGTVLDFKKSGNQYIAQSPSINYQNSNINILYNNKICGFPQTRNFLRDGITKPKDWPWLIAIYLKSVSGLEFLCTGTLISDRHVITAAHCFKEKGNEPLSTSQVLVKLGEYSLQDWANSGSKISSVKNFNFHPQYDGNLGLRSNLAILEIKPIEFSDSILPVCLSVLFEVFEKEPIVLRRNKHMIVGWKHDSKMQLDTPTPQQIVSFTVSNYQCAHYNKHYSLFLSNDTICTENINDNKIQSYGNGLYTSSEQDKWFLNGILSFHLKNATNYDVFVNTDFYNNWIYDVMFPSKYT